MQLDKELKDLEEKILNAEESSVSVLYQNHELQPNQLNIIEKQLSDLINLIDLIVTVCNSKCYSFVTGKIKVLSGCNGCYSYTFLFITFEKKIFFTKKFFP